MSLKIKSSSEKTEKYLYFCKFRPFLYSPGHTKQNFEKNDMQSEKYDVSQIVFFFFNFAFLWPVD